MSTIQRNIPIISWKAIANPNQSREFPIVDFLEHVHGLASFYSSSNMLVTAKASTILNFGFEKVNNLIIKEIGQDNWILLNNAKPVTLSHLLMALGADIPTSVSKYIFLIAYAANKNAPNAKAKYFLSFLTRRALISSELERISKKYLSIIKKSKKVEMHFEMLYVGMLLGMLCDIKLNVIPSNTKLTHKMETLANRYLSENIEVASLLNRARLIAIENWLSNPFCWHNQIADMVLDTILNELRKDKNNYIPANLQRRITNKFIRKAIMPIANELEVVRGVHKKPEQTEENKIRIMRILDNYKRQLK